jgi:hypothetical protein
LNKKRKLADIPRSWVSKYLLVIRDLEVAVAIFEMHLTDTKTPLAFG